jgi:hypothetical protein
MSVAGLNNGASTAAYENLFLKKMVLNPSYVAMVGTEE